MQTLWVQADPASAATVRHRVSAALADLHVGEELIADVALVATELVSNSIRHAAALPDGGLCIDWEVDDGAVLLRVTDGGSTTRPAMGRPGAAALDGRGLVIVDALANRWGVESDSAGVTVWAQLGVAAAAHSVD